MAFNAGVINATFEIKSKTCRESSEYGWASKEWTKLGMNVFIQSKTLIAPYNKDPAVCLQKVRKVKVNNEIVNAVFFDVEKAYDRMWGEGLLIKLQVIGIGGNIYNNNRH